MYPLEYGSKNALVNCVIHAGNDVKKLLNSDYRTKRVGFIGDGASKLLAPSPF